MLGIHDLGLFVVSGLLLNITPGVDFLYVLSRGAARGFAAGFWAALGIGAGCLVHMVAAALGLSAILASSAAAFTVVKWVGAAYLIYVGISMLRQRMPLPAEASATSVSSAAGAVGATSAANAAGGGVAPNGSLSRIFWQGFLTNVLNPKVALFFLAFMPQFIDADSPSKVKAFLLLGAIFNVTGTLWNIFVAWAAAGLLRRFDAASRAGVWMTRCLGGLFVALGLRLALTQRH